MPDELAQQMPVMKEVLTAMNIPIYACEGWEGRTMSIGTVSKICCSKSWECVVVTGDRDSPPAGERLRHGEAGHHQGAVRPIPTRYTPEVFEAGVWLCAHPLDRLKEPHGRQLRQYPRRGRVGPKTATDLLLKFGTLDGVYENIQSSRDSRDPSQEAPGRGGERPALL